MEVILEQRPESLVLLLKDYFSGTEYLGILVVLHTIFESS